MEELSDLWLTQFGIKEALAILLLVIFQKQLNCLLIQQTAEYLPKQTADLLSRLGLAVEQLPALQVVLV
jgi:hypothetical protein